MVPKGGWHPLVKEHTYQGIDVKLAVYPQSQVGRGPHSLIHINTLVHMVLHQGGVNLVLTLCLPSYTLWCHL